MTGGRGPVRRAPLGLFTAAALLCLHGCAGETRRDGGPPPGTVDVYSVPEPVPRVEPRSRYGNPDSYVVDGRRYYVMRDSRGYMERGIASWYGEKFHGRRTSSGETYDMYGMTAAHKTLPLPTYVEVTNLKNGRRTVLRVNDRGPFHGNRIIDLTYTAAAKLDILAEGTGLVEVRAVDPTTYRRERPATVRTAGTDTRPPAFYIQVGAFSKRTNAEILKRRLAALGDIVVTITETVAGGAILYRVRIGPLDRIDDADRIVAGLGEIGITSHHIVTD